MEEFDALNDQLQESATKANVNASDELTDVQYVLIIIGACLPSMVFLANGRDDRFFLAAERFIKWSISQVSQQINFVIMACWCQRIFHLLDEGAEIDHGYVWSMPNGHEVS